MTFRRLIWASLAVAGVVGICVVARASINLWKDKIDGSVQIVNAQVDVVAPDKFLAEGADRAGRRTICWLPGDAE